MKDKKRSREVINEVNSSEDLNSIPVKGIYKLNTRNKNNHSINWCRLTNVVVCYGKGIGPITVRDSESISKYGEHSAGTLVDERFINKDSLVEYAKSQLNPEPTVVHG